MPLAFSGEPGSPGFRVSGLPVMSYRSAAALEKQEPGVPRTYVDLGISAATVWEWHACVCYDPGSGYWLEHGPTRAEAEARLVYHAGSIARHIAQHPQPRRAPENEKVLCGQTPRPAF